MTARRRLFFPLCLANASSSLRLITHSLPPVLMFPPVKLVKWRNVCPDFLVRTLEIRQDKTVRTVIQFHYGTWPDHGVPAAVTPILELVRLMRDVQATETRAILVHCSAGCGRTGTICSIDYVWALLRAGKLDSDFSLYKIIYEMRKQRIAMVQTLEQYMLCYKAVAALFEQQLKIIDAHTYENLDEDGEPLILRSMSMDSNSSSSDILVHSDDSDDPTNGAASVKTFSSEAATVGASSSSSWTQNRMEQHSIDSGIMIGINSAHTECQESGMMQMRREKNKKKDEGEGDESQAGKEEEEQRARGPRDQADKRQQVHQKHVPQQDPSSPPPPPHPPHLPLLPMDGPTTASDCLRLRRAPSLDSLMSCSASAANAANCHLLLHHHHRQLSHPSSRDQPLLPQQQTSSHLLPPASGGLTDSTGGLVRPEKLVGKATVIRRSSIAKLKAMFETLSSGEDNNNCNQNGSLVEPHLHHHHHHSHHRHQDHASRRIRLQRSQSTREKGSNDHHNDHSHHQRGDSDISSCRIFAAAHSFQRRKSAAASTSGVISPMDIGYEAAAVAAQAFSLRLDHGSDGGENEADFVSANKDREEAESTDHPVVSRHTNNDSSQASCTSSSTPASDHSLTDPSSDVSIDHLATSGAGKSSPSLNNQPVNSSAAANGSLLTTTMATTDARTTTTTMMMRETGAVPKKSSLKQSSKSNGRSQSPGKAGAPPKPPRTYQYGPSSVINDKERGRIIARLSTPSGGVSASHQDDDGNTHHAYHHHHQVQQQNILNRNHVSAPVLLPAHHLHHHQPHHQASHPSPQGLQQHMNLMRQQSLQQHLHQQAVVGHHMALGQKPEAIYQSVVPRHLIQRPSPHMHPDFHPLPPQHPHHQAVYHHHQQQQMQQQAIYGMIGMRREYHHLSVPSLFPASQSLSLTPQPGMMLNPHLHPHQHLLQQPLQPLKPVMAGSARIASMQRLPPASAPVSYLHHHHSPPTASQTPPQSNGNPHMVSSNNNNNNGTTAANNRLIKSQKRDDHKSQDAHQLRPSTPTYEDIYDVIPASLQNKRPILGEKGTRPPVTYVRPQPNPRLEESTGNPAVDAKDKNKSHSNNKSHKSQQSSSNKSTASTATSSSSSTCKFKSSSTSQLLLLPSSSSSSSSKNNKSAKEKKDPSSSTSGGKKSFSLSIFFGGSSQSGSKSKNNHANTGKQQQQQSSLHNISSSNNNNNEGRKKKSRDHQSLHHSSVQNLSSGQLSAPTPSSSGNSG